MQFNARERQLIFKVVYYGPPLSGKTTNIQCLYSRLNPTCRGHLTVLDSADDRTLFFDLLPLMVSTQSGLRITIKLFTVPGQVIHSATRRVVLAGADAVAFIADSQISESKRNNEYWHGMHHYLAEAGMDPHAVPTVIQFNKRDLPNVRTAKELLALQSRAPEPIFLASALKGEGVVETLEGLLRLMLSHLDRTLDLTHKFDLDADAFLKQLFRQDNALFAPTAKVKEGDDGNTI